MDPELTLIMLLFLFFATPMVFFLLFCLFKKPFIRKDSAFHTAPEMQRLSRELYCYKYGAKKRI
jgi:hypothetical protein